MTTDSGTETKEAQTSKPVRRNIPFKFFSSEANVQPHQLSESRPFEDKGVLNGTATEIKVTNVRSNPLWLIEFKIADSQPSQPGGARHDQTLPGAIDNLVMFATLPDGQVHGSLGEIDFHRDTRQISFNQWYEVSSDDKQTILDRTQGINKRAGSSLTMDKAAVRFTQFLLK